MASRRMDREMNGSRSKDGSTPGSRANETIGKPKPDYPWAGAAEWLKNSRAGHDEKIQEDIKANKRRTRQEQAEFDRTFDAALKEYKQKRRYGETKREIDPNAEYHHGRKMKPIKTREEVYGKGETKPRQKNQLNEYKSQRNTKNVIDVKQIAEKNNKQSEMRSITQKKTDTRQRLYNAIQQNDSKKVKKNMR